VPIPVLQRAGACEGGVTSRPVAFVEEKVQVGVLPAAMQVLTDAAAARSSRLKGERIELDVASTMPQSMAGV